MLGVLPDTTKIPVNGYKLCMVNNLIVDFCYAVFSYLVSRYRNGN